MALWSMSSFAAVCLLKRLLVYFERPCGRGNLAKKPAQATNQDDNDDAVPSSKILWVAGAIAVALWILNWWYAETYQRASTDLQNGRGTFGDMFGATNALFSGLAFAGVIYTIYLQQRQLRMQRDETLDTKAELARSADAQERMIRPTLLVPFLRDHNDISPFVGALYNGKCFPNNASTLSKDEYAALVTAVLRRARDGQTAVTINLQGNSEQVSLEYSLNALKVFWNRIGATIKLATKDSADPLLSARDLQFVFTDVEFTPHLVEYVRESSIRQNKEYRALLYRGLWLVCCIWLSENPEEKLKYRADWKDFLDRTRSELETGYYA